MSPQVHEGVEYRGVENDVFALGVILFQLVVGHPPFSTAEPNDPWYKWLQLGHSANEFWCKHEGYFQNQPFDEDFKNLVTMMLSYQPHNRPALVDIVAHPWIRKETPATNQEVIEEFERRENQHRAEITARRNQSNATRRSSVSDGSSLKDPEIIRKINE